MAKFKFRSHEALEIAQKIDYEGGLAEAVSGYGLRFGNLHLDILADNVCRALIDLEEALAKAGVPEL